MKVDYRRIPGIAYRRNAELYQNYFYPSTNMGMSGAYNKTDDSRQVNSMNQMSPEKTDENKEVSEELARIPLPNEAEEDIDFSPNTEEISRSHGTAAQNRYFMGSFIGEIILIILILLILSSIEW